MKRLLAIAVALVFASGLWVLGRSDAHQAEPTGKPPQHGQRAHGTKIHHHHGHKAGHKGAEHAAKGRGEHHHHHHKHPHAPDPHHHHPH